MEPAVTAGHRAASSTRIALWDNAKFVMIALVVIDHSLATIRLRNDLAFGIYSAPFFIHMPMLIVIAGYFAKPNLGRKVAHSVMSLVGAWLIWEGIWVVMRAAIAGSPPKSTLLVEPAWSLWFLLTLATMRILLPLVVQLRYPLTISIAAALAAGASAEIGPAFSASRTLCFLPFFVGGWIARDRGLLSGEWFARPSARLRAAAWTIIAVLVVTVVVLASGSGWRIDLWLRWDEGYESMFDASPLGIAGSGGVWSELVVGVAVRLLFYAISAVASVAVLLVLPRSRSVITDWGTRTLYVYLLHAPVIWVLRQLGAMDRLGDFGDLGVLAAMIVGMVLAVTLSGRWVKTITRPVIEPRLRWLFRAA